MKNEKEIISKIRREAQKIGFFKVGFVKPESLNGGEFLKDWIGAGYCGDMGWIGRSFDKRINPANVNPDIKTVISAAISYYSDCGQGNLPATGRISRYALGDDYHDIVKEKLIRMLGFIKTQIHGADGKVFVDSAPVMEKIWAAKANLGWIGKNSLLITRESGSWIFIGDIFLNRKLTENTSPVDDLCGECRKCMEACPTGAIVKPGVIDARRCISYLTIEHKSEISDELKNKMGNWIYGCDVCQEVCPWNKSPAETSEKRFLPRKENMNRNLKELLDMDEEEFNTRFKKSAIKRIGLSRLRRNINIALENKR